MNKVKKEPSTFFCPECNSEKVYARGETLWELNTYMVYCESVKPFDDDAKAECLECKWKGFKRDLIDKTAEIEAAEKLKNDKEYQRYLKLKNKFDGGGVLERAEELKEEIHEMLSTHPAVAVNELDIDVLREPAATLELRSPERYKALSNLIALAEVVKRGE